MAGDTSLDELRAEFRGELITPTDDQYDSARRVWNGMIDKRPSVIARCTGIADVVVAVNFGRENGFPLAVRGGGHSVAGNGVCDDGIVIDLSPLKGVRIDPAARTARAQGGATWGLFDRETQVFGLATTGGVVSTTGIGGLTLGGGLGWLARAFGTTCDNLLSADVVTAPGEIVTASAEENADLLWGLRGGGGNFGVVTSFEYRLHPVGPLVFGGPIFHRGEDAAEALRFFREFVATAPDELTLIAALMTAPEAPFLPDEAHGSLVVGIAACYAGGLEDGERALQPLREFGRPVADLVGPMPYTALQSMFDASYPGGSLQYYWKSNYLDELSDELIEIIVDFARRKTSPFSNFYFEHLGGAIARGEDAAFGHRNALFDFTIISAWADPATAEEHIAWTRAFWEAARPFASDAVYVNNLGAEGEERVRAAYSDQRYDRLVELKNRYDPGNLFRLNQNIQPSLQPASA